MLSRMLAVRATPLHMVAQRPMLVTRSLSVMTRFGGRTGPTSTVVMARSAISSSSFVQAPRPKSSSTTSKPASEAAALRKEAAKIKREAEKAKREAAKLKAKEHKLKQKEKEKERKVKEREKKQREKERAKAKKEKEAAAKKKPSTRTKLTPPKAPQNTWSIFLQDYIEAAKADGSLASRGLNVSQLTREAAPKYHELSSDERAALSRRAEQQKEAWPAIYEEWKRSLTPEMIREENLVRQRRRKLGLAHKRNLRLPDEPKRPLTAFLRFSKDVHSDSTKSYILNGEQDVTKASKLIAAAWREMSPEDKKPYEDQQRAELERYQREKKAWEEKHGISK